MVGNDRFQHVEAETKCRHVADDNFNGIFFNENFRTLIQIPLNLIPKGPTNNKPALV